MFKLPENMISKYAFVTLAATERLQSDLEAAGVQSHFKTYLGVDHAFLNDSRPDVYDAPTATEAWNDLLAFLRAELG